MPVWFMKRDESQKKVKNARYGAQRCPTPPEDEVAPHFFLHNRVPHPYIGLKIGYMRLPSQKNTFLKFVNTVGPFDTIQLRLYTVK